MANQTWVYSTTTLTLTLPARLQEDAMGLEFNQNIERSKGGTTFVESFGTAKQIYPFTTFIWTDHASQLDYADMVAFLLLVNGAENSFVWTDENSVQRTVKILNGSIAFENLGDKKKISVNLEVQ